MMPSFQLEQLTGSNSSSNSLQCDPLSPKHVKAADEDLDSIVVIGLNLSYIVHSANESQLDATGNDAEALRTVE